MPGGEQVYPGYLYDTGIAATGERSLPGILVGPPIPEGNPDPSSIDVEAEAIAAASSFSALGNTHAWTNLSTFSGHGGKLIFYHGSSDPWFSALETVRYFESLGPANGGDAAVSEFSRLYLVPGMGHCSGGDAALDNFDMLSAIVDWVERDVAPEAVVASGNAFPDRSRPLCPYPTHAHYTGIGDTENADNFECR
jgi:feruloyl esterase